MSTEDFGLLTGHCDACNAPVDYCQCGCDCENVSTVKPCDSCHNGGE